MTTTGARRTSLVERAEALRQLAAPRDAGLLAVRVALAWIFIFHGGQDLFGAFHGSGLHAAGRFDADIAHLRPGLFFATLGGIIEFFGGIAIGVGLLSRLAGLALFGDMVMAMITVTFKNGIVSNSTGGGYELNLALAALAAAVVLLGAGRISLDALLGPRLRAATAPSANKPAR